MRIMVGVSPVCFNSSWQVFLASLTLKLSTSSRHSSVTLVSNVNATINEDEGPRFNAQYVDGDRVPDAAWIRLSRHPHITVSQSRFFARF